MAGSWKPPVVAVENQRHPEQDGGYDTTGYEDGEAGFQQELSYFHESPRKPSGHSQRYRRSGQHGSPPASAAAARAASSIFRATLCASIKAAFFSGLVSAVALRPSHTLI